MEKLFNIIEIRKLAAVDMAWLGWRIIIPEYLFGILLPFALGFLSIHRGQILMGIWLVTIAINYIPLFIYAVNLKQTNSIEKEGKPEIVRAKKYGVQQIVILVPLLVVILALLQESRKNDR